jgi:hypothetical protein
MYPKNENGIGKPQNIPNNVEELLIYVIVIAHS